MLGLQPARPEVPHMLASPLSSLLVMLKSQGHVTRRLFLRATSGRMGTASPVLMSRVLGTSQGPFWWVSRGVLPVSASGALGGLCHVL